MLKKIVTIKNVGKFRSCHAAGDVEFRKLTLIYAENGRGKTTVCDILRSLRNNDGDYIQGRGTLGLTELPEVVLRLDGSNPHFQNGRWDTAFPDIVLFDSTFIHENVYAGDYVDHEHKKNLYRVIIGEEGVRLAREVDSLDEKIREANREISSKAASVQASVPQGIQLDRFIALKPEEDLDSKINTKTAEVSALMRAGEINAKAPLSTLALPVSPEDLGEILGKEISDISKDAEQRIHEHIARHTNKADQTWIARGVSYLKEEACPFCGQSLHGNALVSVYRTFFGESYNVLKGQVTTLQQKIRNFYTDATELRFRQTIDGNQDRAAFWRQFESFEIPSLDSNELSAAMRSLQSSMESLIDQKIRSILETVPLSKEFHEAGEKFEQANRQVERYNSAINATNALIAARKAATQSGDLNKARVGLTSLEAVKKRFDPTVDQACKYYTAAVEQKAKLETQKDAAKKKLDEYGSAILSKFERRINQLLEMFSAGFRIAGASRRYVGGTASSTYQVVINDVSIELGDESTPIHEPSFRNTLSAGDKSTLALAFFIAQLELDPDLKEKVIVFDDPFTSQDRSRRVCTQQRICKLAEVSQQVIVLSHEPSFLRSIWDAVPSSTVKTLQFCRIGLQDTTITSWDIQEETKGDYFRNHGVLTKYANDCEGDRRNVARTIRPVLEQYLRFKFPGQFGDSEWLGDFIPKIRDAGTDSPLYAARSILTEVEEINEYSKRYHHSSNPGGADTEPIDDAELQAFVKRTLNVVGGF